MCYVLPGVSLIGLENRKDEIRKLIKMWDLYASYIYRMITKQYVNPIWCVKSSFGKQSNVFIFAK